MTWNNLKIHRPPEETPLQVLTRDASILVGEMRAVWVGDIRIRYFETIDRGKIDIDDVVFWREVSLRLEGV